MEGKGPGKPSKVENLKLASEYLRGLLPQEFATAEPSISEDAATIQARAGEQFQVSTCGQTVLLGGSKREGGAK